VRPRCEAPLMPRHSICSRWADDEPVAKRAHASVKPMPSYPDVQSPPLRGGQAQHESPGGVRSGGHAKREFCGGMRSARPYCRAVHVPRRLIARDG
jgi:hypothetical protein